MWKKAVGFFKGVWSGIVDEDSGLSGLLDKIKAPFVNAWSGEGGIKSAFDAVSEYFTNLIDTIKGLFDFDWTLPSIPLPHFKTTGSFSISWDNGVTWPSFSVEWYKKAMKDGMILDGPTIFGAMDGKLLGGGEAGAEAIVGVSSLMRMIQSAVGGMAAGSVTNVGGITMNIYGAEGQDVKALADVIEDRIVMSIRRSNSGLSRR